MAFDESPRFPTDISYGSQGGPQFMTSIVQLKSGEEQRYQEWTYPLELWNVAYGVKTKALLTSLHSFFMARRGMARGFRFKNHDDFEADSQTLGVGDASTAGFQLVKVYEPSGPAPLTRKITKPVSGTVDVYLDAVLQTITTDYTIDTTTGIVTFNAPPGSGEVVTASFDFDIPARFDTDHFSLELSNYEARSVAIPVRELRR